MSTLESHDLARAIIRALERMAFVLTEEVDEDEMRELADCVYHARISFRGPEYDAEVVLETSQGFLLEFTASMLGLDENEIDLEDLGEQALMELANVIGGEVIMLHGGADKEFKLGLPTSIDSFAMDRVRGERTPDLNCNLESEGEVLKVQIYREAAN